jgi:hypothetical protein
MLLRGTKQSADLETGCLKFTLTPESEGDKDCWFKVIPRYKVRIMGEQVRAGDIGMLENVKVYFST